MKFINSPTFIISLCVGLFLSYITLPQVQIAYVYPTPDNTDLIQYKDNNDTCFKFDSIETECPTDKKLIREYPMQNATQA